MSAVCPICKKEVPAGAKSKPFCSERCRMVDLGKWLNEDYRVPSEDESELDESHPDGPVPPADDEEK